MPKDNITKYWSSSINNFKNMEANELKNRIEKSVKHYQIGEILKSNCIRTYHRTGSLFLPLIGAYYSIYHLSIAYLALDYNTKIEQLSNLGHTDLDKLLIILNDRKIISKKYIDNFRGFKEIRETTNYKMETDHLYDDDSDESDLEVFMEDCFNDFITFLSTFNKKNEKQFKTKELFIKYINTDGWEKIASYFDSNETVHNLEILTEKLRRI